MTAGEVAFSIIMWGLVVTVVWRFVVWEIRDFKASKRARHKQLLQEIITLERELGLDE